MKFRKMMLCLFAAGMMTACGNSSASDSVKQTDEPEEQKETAQTTPVQEEDKTGSTEPYAGFEKGTVIYDQDDLLVTLKDFEDDGSYLTINYEVENNTDHLVRVNISDAYFDGVWATRRNIKTGDFESGSKADGFVTFSKEFFKYYIENEPEIIDLDMVIWNLDNQQRTDYTAVLKSSAADGIGNPADSMTQIGEMNMPDPVRFYQAGILNEKLDVCYVPSGLPVRALAKISIPQVMRSSFVNPSCMGVTVGDWTFLVYIDESDLTESQNMYYASDFLINGEPAECYSMNIPSHAGHGTFLRIGFPEGVKPDDIESFSFRIQCGRYQSDVIEWSF